MVEEPIEETQQGMPTPQHFLDLAIQSATEHQMPLSELIGILYYYTHSVCTSYRDDIQVHHEEVQKALEAEANQE